MTTPAQQACLDAADLIAERGWWNGRKPFKHQSTHCALTAIQKSTEKVPVQKAAMALLQKLIGTNVVLWNDAQGSAEPVIAALRKAGGL